MNEPFEHAAAPDRGPLWREVEDPAPAENTQAKIASLQARLSALASGEDDLPARAGLLCALASLYWVQADYAAAEQTWKQGLEAGQRLNDASLQARCHKGLGNVYVDLSRYKNALAAYRRAIELDPQFTYAYNGLGNVYRDLGLCDEALSAYRQAVALDAQDAYSHHGMGNVYRDLGLYDEALAAYQRAIQCNPRDVYPYTGLANAYRDLGRCDEALLTYQHAAELDPQFAGSYYGIGKQGAHRRRQSRRLAPKHLLPTPPSGHPRRSRPLPL